jgi:very-short-patch-repair endonuclease
LSDAGIPFEREVEFIPGRKYRADFYLPATKTIVEINGGTWVKKCGHSTGRGIQRDYQKSRAAQLLGYVYLQYTPAEVYDLTAIQEVRGGSR